MHLSRSSFILLCIIIQYSIAAHWNYADEGPDVWSDLYPECDGTSQSPIDIDTTTTVYAPLTKFYFGSSYNVPQNFLFMNNGHTLVGHYTGNDASRLSFTGGGLKGVFTFSSFHLHWGENYKSGSEHQVNGAKYSGEIHVIHTNRATNQTAVLGMFIQSIKQVSRTHRKLRNLDTSTTGNVTSAEWIKYLSTVGQLKQVGQPVALNLTLGSLFTSNTKKYWRYSGSLTTPPCTEGIIWTIFRKPIIVSEDYFGLLRNNIYAKDYRSPQPINERTVFRSYPYES
ncbi:unnamed protein product [Adineta steineri]|uniref:Carbonic anhydrase n=1 Tax=Adineta steineri TaxID=433720 RepID=A0A814NHG9_9BILA|nr:unnamed protein product [Adineta steineri]CAF0968049.1 unnamed protein product [Adineta steineri]CAF1091649.1 unnamed protein product [Adineta steineri]